MVPELWGRTIFGPNMAHFTKWEFFQKTCCWALFFFHSCLSTCQKSKSDIDLLAKYWRLQNTEISLAERHFWLTCEPDFPQACSFRRMLINQKNFPFIQIPDKHNDVIFLKSPKTMFLGHFWQFLVIFAWWRFFPKKSDCHTQLYMGP